MTKRFYAIGNGLAFGATIAMNYLSNTGIINGQTIGGVSANYDNLFTPASYAFSIWGLIYLLLLGFMLYQGKSLLGKLKHDDFILRIGPWFMISCLANSLWVICWLNGWLGLSLVCMFSLLISLLVIIVKNDMEIWDAPLSVIFYLWWPFVIYAGWITVASIANVAAYLTQQNTFADMQTQIWITVLMIVIAVGINLYMTWTRNLREYALVGAWALAAIYVANKGEVHTVAYAAITGAVVLFLSSSYHGYINRATSPLAKLRAGKKHK